MRAEDVSPILGTTAFAFHVCRNRFWFAEGDGGFFDDVDSLFNWYRVLSDSEQRCPLAAPTLQIGHVY
jgi:hypothetical protein